MDVANQLQKVMVIPLPLVVTVVLQVVVPDAPKAPLNQAVAVAAAQHQPVRPATHVALLSQAVVAQVLPRAVVPAMHQVRQQQQKAGETHMVVVKQVLAKELLHVGVEEVMDAAAVANLKSHLS
jgi:hypothetical protein